MHKTSSLSVAGLVIIVLIVVATLVRFIDLTKSPPGFYIDEAAISAQVICVRESGANLQGERWPIFTEVLGGGYMTAAYLYPAVAWTAIFGDSIASFRSLAAFYSALFIAGCFVLGRRFWMSLEAAWLCALAAAVSPWVFQFARIAWDPSLSPAYMVWAFALLWGEGKFRKVEFALSGLLFSVAAYSYPPLRLQLAITLPLALIGLVLVLKRSWKLYFITVATALIASLPLIELTLNGRIQGRFQLLSIFNPNYLMQTYGSDQAVYGFMALAKNFRLLLSPSYLFMRGDANLRHSTGSFGVWSWLDGLGLLAAVIALTGQTLRSKLRGVPKFKITFVIVGYLAGILPAALTWESNPHALRSFGAVMFLVLGVGGGLSLLWTYSRTAKSAVVGLAFVSFLLFVHVFFNEYPKNARLYFDTDVSELATQLSNENRITELADALQRRGVDYAPMAITYYGLADGSVRCPLKTRPATH